MVETILLQILIKKGVAVHLAVDAVVSNNIGIELKPTGSSCVIILSISTIASPWITLANITHMNILMHHCSITIVSVRGVDHVTWEKRTLIQIGPGTWHPNRFLS